LKHIILIILLLNVCPCSAQTIEATDSNLKLDVNFDSILSDTSWTSFFNLPECPFTIENAITDIKNDSLKIVIHGGFVGFGDIDSIRSDNFQKKYNVTFKYVGCVRNWDEKNEDTHGYNDKIFEYLRRKYGKGMIKEFQSIWN